MSFEQFRDCFLADRKPYDRGGPVPRLAYPIESAPAVTGIPRTKIFEAVRAKQLTVRKIGRSTIIEHDELMRFLKSLPSKGRALEATQQSASA
jgi:hypothetical protein